MTRLTLLLLLIFPLTFTAQEFIWAKRLGGLNRDILSSTATDAQGFSYHVGYFSGSINFQSESTVLSAQGEDDIFFIKYDKDGELIWAKKISGNADEYAQELIRLDDGTLLLFGRFKGSTDFDMGDDEHLLTSTGSGFNTFLANYDTDGNLNWTRHFTGDGSNTPYDMRIDHEGSIYLSGRFTNSFDLDPDPDSTHVIASSGNTNSYLIKLDSNASFEWGKHFKGSASVLAVDFLVYDDEVYYVGNFQGSLTIAPDNPPTQFAAGVNDLFLARFDIDGTLDTLLAYGSIRNDEFGGIAVNHNGIYLSGTFLTEIDINPDPLVTETLTSNGGVDAFALALNHDLEFQWAQYFGGSNFDLGGNIRVNYDGTLLYGLGYNNQISLDVGGETLELTSAGGTDAALLSLDASDGSVNSVYEIKGTGSEFALITDFYDGTFLLSGAFEGSTDLNNVGSGNYIVTSQGLYDSFIMNVDLGIVSATHEIPVHQSLQLHPVPIAPGEILMLNNKNQEGTLEIFNSQGMIVFKEKSISNQIHIPSTLSPGVYFVLFAGDDGSSHVGKLVVR